MFFRHCYRMIFLFQFLIVFFLSWPVVVSNLVLSIDLVRNFWIFSDVAASLFCIANGAKLSFPSVWIKISFKRSPVLWKEKHAAFSKYKIAIHKKEKAHFCCATFTFFQKRKAYISNSCIVNQWYCLEKPNQRYKNATTRNLVDLWYSLEKPNQKISRIEKPISCTAFRFFYEMKICFSSNYNADQGYWPFLLLFSKYQGYYVFLVTLVFFCCNCRDLIASQLYFAVSFYVAFVFFQVSSCYTICLQCFHNCHFDSVIINLFHKPQTFLYGIPFELCCASVKLFILSQIHSNNIQSYSFPNNNSYWKHFMLSPMLFQSCYIYPLVRYKCWPLALE